MTPVSDLLKIRRSVVEMVYLAKEGHIPSAFSIIEILYTLYSECLRVDPSAHQDDDRDYFVLSKGHAGAALYATLAHFGFFPPEGLRGYCQPGSPFGGHPDATKGHGVEVSSGSLGHGIAMAVGISLGLRAQSRPNRVVSLVGDGEMDEGSLWEALMLARTAGLTNFVVIADCNSSQKYFNGFDIGTIARAIGYEYAEVDGHDLTALSSTLKPLMNRQVESPLTFVRANTVKGYGVKRFIGDHGWHRRTPSESEYSEIIKELTP